MVVVGYQRYRRMCRHRKLHETRINRWIQQYYLELKEHSEAQMEIGDTDFRNPHLEVESQWIFELWKMGTLLSCDPEMLDQLKAPAALRGVGRRGS